MKKITAFSCIMIILTILISNSIFAEIRKDNWTFVSDDLYKVLQIKSTEPVLIKYLQDKDYEEFFESMVVSSDSDVNSTRNDDPDSFTVDNMLPDGRTLSDGWEKALMEMVEKKANVKSLKDNKLNTSELSTFTIEVETSSGPEQYRMSTTLQNNKQVTVPLRMTDLPFQFAISPDGTQSVMGTDAGLWHLKNGGKKAVKISKDTYDNKSYKMLQEEFDGQDKLYWNEGVIFSPDSTKLAYISNKGSLKTEKKKQSLFIYDLISGKESLVKKGVDEHYVLDGWLNSEFLLSEKWTDNGIGFYAIDLKGKEIDLKLKGDNIVLLAVKDNHIAYSPDYQTNLVIIAEFDGMSMNTLDTINLDGRLIISGRFSDGATKFACIFAPSKNDRLRHLSIYDLQKKETRTINQLPMKNNKVNIIRDFYFLEGDQMLVNIGEVDKARINESTWIYTFDSK